MSNMAVDAYNRQGAVFTACNQSAATVTLINTSTATGFILSNPFGSARKLVLISVGFQYSTVPSATSIPFLAGSIAPSPTAHATTTAITVYGADGSGSNVGNAARAYSASTTPNLPAYLLSLGYAPTTPATSGGLSFRTMLEGAIVLVPGSYVQMSYLGQAPVGICDMTWAEVGLTF